MANFLEALGDTLLMGNQLAGRARAEKRQEELDSQAKTMQNLQAAILQGQQQQQQQSMIDRASENVLAAGPGAMVDDAGAQAVIKAGKGNRLGPQFEEHEGFDPLLGTPAKVMQAGQRILPTWEQQRQIDSDKESNELHGLQIGELRSNAADRTKQTVARNYIGTPEFWKNSPEKRQVAWAQGGYSGQAPLTDAEMQSRLQFESNLDIAKVKAQGEFGKPRIDIRNIPTMQGGVPGTKTVTFMNGMPIREEWNPANPSGSDLDQISDFGVLQNKFKGVRNAYRPELVGPAAGRYGQGAQAVPGMTVPEGFTDLSSRLAQVQNAMIYLKSGKQINEQEFARLQAELPLITDKSDVFEQKLTNAETYMNDLIEGRRAAHGMGGQQPSRPGATPGAGNTTPGAPSSKFTIVGVH
jgi:hypothetical protein